MFKWHLTYIKLKVLFTHEFIKMSFHLPDDMSFIIRDSSQFVTRSDWRTLHRMTITDFYNQVRGSPKKILRDVCSSIKPQVSTCYIKRANGEIIKTMHLFTLPEF
jgi:hypothetical protein